MRELFRNPYGAFSDDGRQCLCRVGIVACLLVLMPGCSLSVPMPGMGLDPAPTGSIKAVDPSPFASEMDAEDWRRAKSALDTALDPQGNGASVAWSNPQSGARGTFVPLAQPYPQDDGICRSFSAVLDMKGKVSRSLRSSACRRNGGEWIVGKIAPASDPRAASPRKSGNLAERATNTQLR